jgi:hypothetical protein
MASIKRQTVVVLMAVLVTLPTLIRAQTQTTNRPTASPDTGPVISGDSDSTKGDGGSTTPSLSSDRQGRVLPAPTPTSQDPAPVTVRPVRPEQNDVTEQVKEQLNLFEIQRKEFLEQRRILLEKYRGASEAERERIRERFQELLKRWTEVSKERSVEADVRQRVLETRLKAHQELLQQAREQAREQALDQTRERVRGRD